MTAASGRYFCEQTFVRGKSSRGACRVPRRAPAVLAAGGSGVEPAAEPAATAACAGRLLVLLSVMAAKRKQSSSGSSSSSRSMPVIAACLPASYTRVASGSHTTGARNLAFRLCGYANCVHTGTYQLP